MSDLFKPQVEKTKEPAAKPLRQVQGRGRVGRTIIGGAMTAQKKETQTEKKTILGG